MFLFSIKQYPFCLIENEPDKAEPIAEIILLF